jgi:hypothetical protein
VAKINVIKAEQVLEIPNYGFCCQSAAATVQNGGREEDF